MRSGSRVTLRWSTTGTRTARSPKVTRWVVYLDGRRVRTLRATGAKRIQKLRHRVRTTGAHRWRVDGRAANGRRVLSASRAFRVLRT